MRKKVTKPHYVDNKRFYQEIILYHQRVKEAQEQGKEEPRIPDYIGECITKIAMRLSTKPNFINYSYRDEMISDAIENCIIYFKDFNPEISSNPFAYFTQTVHNAFIRRIGKEERNRYTMYKNFQENIIGMHDTALLTDSDDRHLLPTQMYDNINDFMDRFEKKEAIKKAKRKEKKEGLLRFYEDKNERT